MLRQLDNCPCPVWSAGVLLLHPPLLQMSSSHQGLIEISLLGTPQGDCLCIMGIGMLEHASIQLVRSTDHLIQDRVDNPFLVIPIQTKLKIAEFMISSEFISFKGMESYLCRYEPIKSY